MESVSKHFQALRLSDLAPMRAFIRDVLHNMAVPATVADDLILATDEAVANILIHGYKKQPGNVAITVERDHAMLSITLCDQAPLFDPTIITRFDSSIPLTERPFGGMGLHLIRQVVDQLQYQVTTAGENQLVLQKDIRNL